MDELYINKAKGACKKYRATVRKPIENLRNTEFDRALNKKMSFDRSIGPDGLTANLYKHFWEDLKRPLFQVIQERLIRKEIIEQGLIKLL